MGEFYNNQWRLLNNENKDKSSNYSMSFDGSSEYIGCGDNLNFERTDSFSASVWVKPDATEVSQILGKQLNSSPFSGYAIQTTVSNKIRIVLMNGTTNRIYVDTTSTISTSSWYHIAFTYDGSSSVTGVKIYIDGSPVSSSTVYDNLTLSISNNASFSIGSRNNAGLNFNGKIDHVAIFDYVLSSSQISDLYGNSTNGVGDPMSLSTKPVAYYKLGEKAAFNGSEYLVTNSASEVFSPYALDFDGSDYIELPNTAVLNSGSDGYTISSWVNISSTSGDKTIYSTEYNEGVVFLIAGDDIKFYQAINGPSWVYFTVDSSHALSINTWYNIVASWDGSNNVKIYLNGSLIDTETGFTSLQNPTTPSQSPKIGVYNNNQLFMNGKLSNVSIWNAALTASQVTELYNSGKPSDLNTHSAASNLVSWWQLGANSSFNSQWTVLDEVGTNNGTSYGMAENDLVNGPGTTANGLSSGMGSGNNVIGEAPFSTANALSIDMGVEARSDDTPS